MREIVDIERVLEWMQNDERPANIAFTAGPERQLAYAFEVLSNQCDERVRLAEAKLKLAEEALAWPLEPSPINARNAQVIDLWLEHNRKALAELRKA